MKIYVITYKNFNPETSNLEVNVNEIFSTKEIAEKYLKENLDKLKYYSDIYEEACGAEYMAKQNFLKLNPEPTAKHSIFSYLHISPPLNYQEIEEHHNRLLNACNNAFKDSIDKSTLNDEEKESFKYACGPYSDTPYEITQYEDYEGMKVFEIEFN